MCSIDPISPIIDILFKCWDCTVPRQSLIVNLEDNLETLARMRNDLLLLSEDTRAKVKLAESQGQERTRQVVGWFKDVEAISREVQRMLDDGDLEKEKKALGGCCPKKCRCLPRYNLAKQVAVKRKRLRELEDKVPQELSYKAADPVVAKRPLRELVGNEATFEEAWRYVEDDRVRTIGIVGMGGIGKTALLTKINNELSRRSHRYNFVIWITVSKIVDIVKIQKEIWNKLNLPKAEWENEADRASKILCKMEQQTFLLFLDDIWEMIDLSKIGVPSLNYENKSKVIFTTRSKDVCRWMKADKLIKVGLLGPDKAFELFQEMVGSNTLSADPEILRLAKLMAGQCKCLPLALITVGSAMAGEMNIDEWERSIEILRRQRSKFKGMVEEVLVPLKFSYDRLPDETQKKCFLSCAMFPQDDEIDQDHLIDLWMGEGHLYQYGGSNRLWKNGEHIVEHLSRACLLEFITPPHTKNHSLSPLYAVPIIKMHDVVREMALWVSEMERKKIICEEKPSFTAEQCKKWEDADKLSLWKVDDQSIGKWISGSTLSTLLLRGSGIKGEGLTTIPMDFFSFVPSLRTLDLSWNLELRDLSKSFGQLKDLQYLNLRGTQVKVPEELRSLTKLVVLILGHSNMPVPKGMISSLCSLRVFSILDSSAELDSHVKEDDELNMIEELGDLPEITELSVDLKYAESAKKLLSNSRLQNCLTSATLQFNDRADPIQLRGMNRLMCLWLEQYTGLEIQILRRLDSFSCLRFLYLFNCGKLQDVTALIYCAPTLEVLTLGRCDEMKEVIRNNGDGQYIDEEDDHDDGVEVVIARVSPIFSRLNHLGLRWNRNLKSIYSGVLPLRRLEVIHICGCPELKKLPLDSKSCDAGKTLRVIYGEKKWWDGLEWDHDPNAKHIFSPNSKGPGFNNIKWPR